MKYLMHYNIQEDIVLLDAPFSDGEDSSLINVIEDEQEKDPDNKVMDTSMKEEIASALSTLQKENVQLLKCILVLIEIDLSLK
ncbi:MAG: hypothetical protein Ct9H90mP15_08820 [Candidatus Neomarinimicrobiota bacterium]|nr:MAG: hypothetical protein Ct9H90mP15_08820 [Candidatus Neomarinimicrobiota bacterium]